MVSPAQATTGATWQASVWGLVMTPLAVRFQIHHTYNADSFNLNSMHISQRH
jgi:hypothetical protein